MPDSSSVRGKTAEEIKKKKKKKKRKNALFLFTIGSFIMT